MTVVGHSATITAGEWITASGEWVNDRTHGQQFKAKFLQYLSSGMIRGVGPVYAKKLVPYGPIMCGCPTWKSVLSARSAFTAAPMSGRCLQRTAPARGVLKAEDFAPMPKANRIGTSRL